MDQVPVSQWAPKFGNINNSEPAVQGEVTINTYLRKGEFAVRNYRVSVAKDDDRNVVFPYGKMAAKEEVEGVEEHEVALLVKEAPHDPTGARKDNRKRYREGAVRPKGKMVDNYPLVITSLNALYIQSKHDNFANLYWTLPDEVKKAYIRKEFCPIGVIGTPNDLASKDNRYTFPYFPTRIAGVFSMQNGPEQVYAGQYVMIDAPLPDKKQFKRATNLAKFSRLPDDKVTMEIVPIDSRKLASFMALEEYIENLDQGKLNYINGLVNVQDDEVTCIEEFIAVNLDLLDELSREVRTVESIQRTFAGKKELLKKLYKTYFNVRTEFCERVIGRALTHTQEGAEGDVYIGKGYFL